MRKIAVIGGVTLIAVLAAVAIAVSLLVNIDSFRPQLARAMSAAAGRQVAIGRISLSLLSGSAVVEDLAVADDPAFGATPFATAKTVRIGIAILPLLTAKHLQVKSLRVHEPKVSLRRSAAGAWNFATLGASAGATGGDGTSSSGLTLSIDRMTIDGGEVVVERAPARNARDVYKDFAVDLRNLSATTPFAFEIGVAMAGGGRVKLGGQAGPFSLAGIGSTPFAATLDAIRVDVARAGVIDPGGVAGLIDAHLQVASAGERITASGTLRGDKMQVVAGAQPATRPVEIAFASDYNLRTHDGVVTRGDLHVGGASARLLGRFNTRAATPSVHFTLAGDHMPVADLQALLPAIGATLPRGARFRSGSMKLSLTADGPTDRVVIAGPIAMSDATLAGFDLGAHMQALAAFAGVRGTGETTIQTLALTMRIAAAGVRIADLSGVVAGVGSLEGAGTIAPNSALDFAMVAKFTRTTGVVGDLTRAASFGNPENGIPFRIAGTTASPVFAPDIRRAAAGAVRNGGLSKAAGAVRSWFEKFKR